MIISPLEHAHDFQKVFGLTRLATTIDKAEAALGTLEPETIDYCKCVIEIICKHILSERGIPYDDLKLPKLVKQALSSCGFDNEGIAGNLSGIVGALAEIRNRTGIAGHGQHDSQDMPSQTDIRIFVSIFESVISLLWHAFNKFNIDLTLTKLRFDLIEQRLELASFNEVLDVSTSITHDQEEGRIYINGKEVRPSELLFIFDRNSYSEELKKFQISEVVAESEEEASAT
ncbi:abortive infection family protein [Hyphomonas sp. KY3]|uniref:abortive infection family protein n=1 Tax=Hyphomonas sp. KY3 TaxID=2016196 RepID=UPI001A8E0240|nr:abortive infection family protein [Hyphomonas sp. KY3]QSR21047.1 hypothetical protein CFA77_01925 [Hyphomonas sp. KY3]